MDNNRDKGRDTGDAGLIYKASQLETQEVTEEELKAINKFTDMLEDLEDVQDVYTNMETTDEVDAALEAEG